LSTSRIAGAPKLLAPIIGQFLASNRHAMAAVAAAASKTAAERLFCRTSVPGPPMAHQWM